MSGKGLDEIKTPDWWDSKGEAEKELKELHSAAPRILTKPAKWMRRDYSKQFAEMDKAIATMDTVAVVGFPSRRAANNARFDFYKARGQHRAVAQSDPAELYDSLAFRVAYTNRGWAIMIEVISTDAVSGNDVEELPPPDLDEL